MWGGEGEGVVPGFVIQPHRELYPCCQARKWRKDRVNSLGTRLRPLWATNTMNVPINVVNENAIHMCGHVLYLNEPKWSPYKQYTNSNPAMDLFTMLVWGACSSDRVMWSTCDWVMWSTRVCESCGWVIRSTRDWFCDQVMWSTWSNHVIESCDQLVCESCDWVVIKSCDQHDQIMWLSHVTIRLNC